MYIVSWTVDHGQSNLDDSFQLFETRSEAHRFVDHQLLPLERLHCWAVSEVLSASEPHWMEAVA